MQRELLEFEDAMQLLPAESESDPEPKAATEADTNTKANVEPDHAKGKGGTKEALATAQHRFAVGAHRYRRRAAESDPPRT